MNPILLDFPDCFDTARLTIRAPRKGDGAEVNAAVCESLPELQLWMPWAQKAPTVEESEALMREAAANFILRKDLWLLLFLKGTGTLVGASGLHRMDWTVPRFEIGYWVRTRFAGQGYITEAVQGITAFAFDALMARRVEIRCDHNNQLSRQVAERAGFTLEATLHNHSRTVTGELRDTLVFVKFAT